MTVILKILRYDTKQYWQSFEYPIQNNHDTIASALTYLNSLEELKDIDGNVVTPIGWECSCLQKKCGACAMVINNRPSLSCDVLISDIKEDVITIEPLRKFPVIKDLIVDRSILYKNLETLQIWLKEDAKCNDYYYDYAYNGSICIQCGCCLEICPNFYVGGKFYGMSTLPLTTRILSEQDKEDYKELAKSYSKHLYAGCGKSLACKNICPRHIDTEKLMVNANMLAIWKRKKRK